MKTTLENVRPITRTPPAPPSAANRIGSILMVEGKLTAAENKRVLEYQQEHNVRFGEAAIRLGFLCEEDLERGLARQNDLQETHNAAEVSAGDLIVSHPAHPRTEELRALRTQLLLRWLERKINSPSAYQGTQSDAFADVRCSLAIVSPGQGEGRSALAANLAVLFSKMGEHTLLIDADLRRPRQQAIFGVESKVGLSTYLSGRTERPPVISLPRFPRLSLLPAGPVPTNPQELVSSGGFATMLGEMRHRYDVILIDTPPAAFYADAQAVAFRSLDALVLTRKGHTRLDEVRKAVRDIQDSGARVVGTVISAF